MKRIIAAAAIAAILAIATACGGDSEDRGEENLHPVLEDHTHTQVQEWREYVTMWGDVSRHDLSDRINALHEMGYEIEHTTRNRYGNYLLIFRKIPHPEGSVLPNSTPPTN